MAQNASIDFKNSTNVITTIGKKNN